MEGNPLIHIGGKTYELVKEHKNGFNYEAFRDRYSEVLDRYDYIVGDWGYNQLRLKGFFKDSNQKSTKETAFSGLFDYLNEYCNFGCAYFVLEKVNGKPHHRESNRDAQKDGAREYRHKEHHKERHRVNVREHANKEHREKTKEQPIFPVNDRR